MSEDPVRRAREITSSGADAAARIALIESIGLELLDPFSGAFRWERSALALLELGALDALAAAALDPRAPDRARLAALQHLARALRGAAPLPEVVAELLGARCPVPLQISALEIVAGYRIGGLDALVTARLSHRAPPVRSAAARAAKALGLSEALWLPSCLERLQQAESALDAAGDAGTIRALQAERAEALRDLAGGRRDGGRALLLRRRFRPGISEVVRALLDAQPRPPEEPGADPSALLAADPVRVYAAAHALSGAPLLDPAALASLLDPALPLDTLLAAAGLLRGRPEPSLAAPLEALLEALVERVEGPRWMEVYLVLWEALGRLDRGRADRMGLRADYAFCVRRVEAVRPERWPWCVAAWALRPSTETICEMLEAGGEDARAAIFRLAAFGAGTLRTLERDDAPTLLSQAARSAMGEAAEASLAGGDALWVRRIACAAAECQLTELLPWLVRAAQVQGAAEGASPGFGAFREPAAADVLRAAGYLARIDIERGGDGGEAPALLTSTRPDDALTPGWATGLGFLGVWVPLLEALGPEPWLHEAAHNLFRDYATSPGVRSAALSWIRARLGRGDLHGPVRSTLQQLEASLERRG